MESNEGTQPFAVVNCKADKAGEGRATDHQPGFFHCCLGNVPATSIENRKNSRLLGNFWEEHLQGLVPIAQQKV